MRSELAVISRDVIRYRYTGFVKIHVSIIRHLLRFHTSKKTFHRAVIKAIPSGAAEDEYQVKAASLMDTEKTK